MNTTRRERRTKRKIISKGAGMPYRAGLWSPVSKYGPTTTAGNEIEGMIRREADLVGVGKGARS